MKTYYTLCKYDTESAQWFDEYGSYSKAECREELEGMKGWGDTKARHLCIIASDGSAADMITKRDALPKPKA